MGELFSIMTALMRKASELMEPATEERHAKDEFIARTRRSRADWNQLLREKATDWRRFWGESIGSSHPS